MHKRIPIWQNRQSALECGLTVVAVSRVILCIALTVGTAEALSTEPPAEDMQTVSRRAGNEEVCLSPECIDAATNIIKNLDPDVEPCNDFYRFACGGFLKSTTIPDDKDYVDTFTIMKDQLEIQLRASMEEPIGPNEPKPFRLIKNLYKSCMNETAIEEQGLEFFHKILKKLGGWPVLDGEMWNETDFDWISSIYKFRDTGYYINYFFSFGVVVDWMNTTRRVIKLDTADLGDFYGDLLKGFDSENVKAYYSYMVDIAVLLGAERERASTELKESLLFEINLANISSAVGDRINETLSYNLMTLDELTYNYSSIPWREYFDKLLPKNITVEENEVVMVNRPIYISDLEKLLLKTPKKVQANYVIWRAVEASVNYLNDNIRKRQLAYSTALNKKTISRSRWQECIDIVSALLPLSVNAMYVMKYFNPEAKQDVTDIVTDVRKQFYKILEQTEWIDAKTRNTMLEKVTAMTSHVAYPDELLNETRLEKIYENLELSGGNYLHSIFNLTVFNVDYSFGKLREPVNESNWLRRGRQAAATAFYARSRNSMHFSAGILHSPFFDSNRPRYMNFGGIGFVIGHEMTHAFDYMTHQIVQDDNFSDWLSTEEHYLERVECIIYQYGNYTADEVGLQLDGIKTESDNIADNVGMKVAYRAYNDWAERNEPEQKLIGLPYSPNQMFWISAAIPWCAKYKPEELKLRINTGWHSPSEFRILGSLSNMPEFSKDFNCPIGSKMNPEKKCSVW